jgi:hypothetical protein
MISAMISVGEGGVGSTAKKSAGVAPASGAEEGIWPTASLVDVGGDRGSVRIKGGGVGMCATGSAEGDENSGCESVTLSRSCPAGTVAGGAENAGGTGMVATGNAGAVHSRGTGSRGGVRRLSALGVNGGGVMFIGAS